MKALTAFILCLMFTTQSFAGSYPTLKKEDIKVLIAEDKLDQIENLQFELTRLQSEKKILEKDITTELDKIKKVQQAKGSRLAMGAMITVGVGIGMIEFLTYKVTEGAFAGMGGILAVLGTGALIVNEIHLLTLSVGDATELLKQLKLLDAEIAAKNTELQTAKNKNCLLAVEHVTCK